MKEEKRWRVDKGCTGTRTGLAVSITGEPSDDADTVCDVLAEKFCHEGAGDGLRIELVHTIERGYFVASASRSDTPGTWVGGGGAPRKLPLPKSTDASEEVRSVLRDAGITVYA
jgi:hypothetical protein